MLHFGDLIKKGLLSEAEANQFKLKNKPIRTDYETPGEVHGEASTENKAKTSPIIETSDVVEINLALSEVSATNLPLANSNGFNGSSNKSPNKQQRYKRVDQIGVFSELLTVFKTNNIKFSAIPSIEILKPINEQIVSSLKLISMGFFENNPPYKAQHFREAKNILARVVIDLKLSSTLAPASTESHESLNQKIEIQIQEAIIPGLIGLINRVEKRFFHRSDPTTRQNK